MNARQFFETVSSAPTCSLIGLDLDKAHDHLLVTGLYIAKPLHAMKAAASNTFVQKLDARSEANETLNSIALWMKKTGSMDQRDIYGDNRFDYNISFHRLHEAEQPFSSLVQNFYLEDFIFAHNSPEQASNFDDLMRMLDRDKLADAMLDSLKNDFGMKARETAPLFWRRDIRQCSHPDYSKPAPSPERVLLPA